MFMHTLIRPFRPRLVTPKQVISSASPCHISSTRARRLCDIDDRLVDGIWIHDLTCKPGKAEPHEKGRKKRIIYFAGGGWQMPPTTDHWALVAELARRVPNSTVTLVGYPLAPKCPASVSMPRLRDLYDTLMKEAVAKDEQVVFAGDSSGGNIALCLVTWALTDPEALAPAAIMGICPTADLRHVNVHLTHAEKRDPLFTLAFINSTAQAWTGGGPTPEDLVPVVPSAGPLQHGDWHASDPRVSPIFAPLGPLVERGVKVHGVTGTHDILSVEAVEFRERCQQEGVEGEWLEWVNQMHCFPLAFRYRLKESVEGVDWIVDVLQRV
jgi:acetyl esterase/lipase